MPPKTWEVHAARRAPSRSLRRYLLVCEDAKSSVNYLLSFDVPKTVAEIVPVPGAGNTDGAVERALEMRQHAIDQKSPYVKIWCVIDRDEFPAHKFNRAFQLARPYQDVQVIWANEAFELWYLLHFCYRDTPIGRHELVSELSKEGRLGKKYDKADTSIFERLRPLTPTAIKHASRLERYYGADLNPERDNPSTNAHKLVQSLLALKEAAL